MYKISLKVINDVNITCHIFKKEENVDAKRY